MSRSVSHQVVTIIVGRIIWALTIFALVRFVFVMLYTIANFGLLFQGISWASLRAPKNGPGNRPGRLLFLPASLGTICADSSLTHSRAVVCTRDL